MWQLIKEYLWLQIFIGLILGVGVGLFLGPKAVVLEPVGMLFIRLIQMLIMPLVFFSIVSAIVSMDALYVLRSKGGKSLVFYLVTTAFAIGIGLFIGELLQPGAGVDFKGMSFGGVRDVVVPDFVTTLVSIVPLNPVLAFSEGNVLQIIVFAILLGVAIQLAGTKGKYAANFMNSAAEVMFTMTHIVMRVAPLGVFALMAWMVASQDVDVLSGLLQVVFAVLVASVLHMGFVYGGIVRLFGKVNPQLFFLKMLPVQTMALSTTSSAATLPITLETAEKRVGVSRETSSFVLPLGTTVNMDGTAIYQGVCIMFVAQGLGAELMLSHYLIIILTATLASIGTAGVPSAGLIMLSLVLSSVGLPVEAVAIIAGVDRLLDMIRTTVNVTGDVAVALAVDSMEGGFDEVRYRMRVME